MADEVLRRALDTAGNRIFGLPAPSATGEPTYVDHVTAPRPPGTASSGVSFLAAPADHVHPSTAGGANYDAILVSDPASPTINYAATYVGGVLVSESWTNLASQLVKTVAYAYSGGLVATEVRKAYDTSTGAVAAQVTYVYAYSGPILQSYAMSRDLGTPTSPAIDTLLESDPVSAGITYTTTYGAGYISDEAWRYTASGLAVKSIHYVYTLGLALSSEVRRVYGPDGTTIVGQVTCTYTYTAGILASIGKTRDV